MSRANYESAVALLKERYGYPQEIINAHMDALVNFPIVENARDLKALRHLYDGRNHSSICDPTEAPESPVSTETQRHKRTVGEKKATSSVNTVLLQTGKATVYNPGNSHRKLTIGIILDGGSQRSYVTERVRDALNLPVSRSESQSSPLVQTLEFTSSAK